MGSKQRQFQAIMEMAGHVERNDPRGLVELVRLCAATILGDFLSWRIRSRAGKARNGTQSDFLFLPLGTKIDNTGRTLDQLCQDTGERPRIRLGKDIVLPWPWNRFRLARSLGLIGVGRKWHKWTCHPENHYVELWRPLGITWALNGNHSITAGIIRCEGVLRPNVVRNIAPIYKYVHCDGMWFFRTADGVKLSPVNSPMFAGIFEIGRIMTRHNICV